MEFSVLGEGTIGKRCRDVDHQNLVRLTLTQFRFVWATSSRHYTDVCLEEKASQKVKSGNEVKVSHDTSE